MALGSDLTMQAPPARIPKLKYRNPLPAGELAQLPLRTRLIDAQEPPASPLSTVSSCDYRPSLDSLTSSSLASSHSSAESSNGSKTSKAKKKASSVFGFLSLKEPSQLALEQYADAQRKQASGESSPIRPGSIFPSQKLPPHVPKVNSKWDGVPSSAKKRLSSSTSRSSASSVRNRWSSSSRDSQAQAAQLNTMMANSSRFSVMTDGTQNPPNSIASSESSIIIHDDDQLRSNPSSPRSVPEMSYYFPEPIASSAPPAPVTQTIVYRPAATISPPLSPDFVMNSSPVKQPTCPRPDSPASSTGSGDTIVRDTADAIFQKLNDQPHKGVWAAAPAVQPSVESPPGIVPESHDFLFGDDALPGIPNGGLPIAIPIATSVTTPDEDDDATPPPIPHYAPNRPVPNFSRPTLSSHTPPRSPVTPSYRTTPTSSGLPTLYEASLASIDHDEADYDDDTESIAPSTIAPSVLSGHWHDSPRERLGLGGQLRMGDRMPWEGQTESPGKKKRLSLFGKVTTRT